MFIHNDGNRKINEHISVVADIMNAAGQTSVMDAFSSVAVKMVILGCVCFVCAWTGIILNHYNVLG